MATRKATTNKAKAKSKVSYEEQQCSAPVSTNRELPAAINPRRAGLIRVIEKKWVNGTQLGYYFFDKSKDNSDPAWSGTSADKQAVVAAFATWKDLGIGLEFVEVDNPADAEIRIGFDHTDGSWSYVGRDIIDHASDPGERTMNFGWRLTTAYGRKTALHEIGHTLGFPHEHQNPNAGIEWDTQAVLDRFSSPPNNWPHQTTHWNILRKLSPAEVEGSTWDPDSIMHYSFGPGLILKPETYGRTGITPPLTLSDTDKSEVKKFYPPINEDRIENLVPYESMRFQIAAGQQVDFRIKPDVTRRYTIQTFGQADTLMVLFETTDGTSQYISGDDDSGRSLNAKFRERLYRNREYVLRIRLYWAQAEGNAAVFMY